MLLGSTRDDGPAASQVVPVRLIVGETTPQVRARRAPGAMVAPREASR